MTYKFFFRYYETIFLPVLFLTKYKAEYFSNILFVKQNNNNDT